MRALIVDDDPVFRALVKGWLRANCSIIADEARDGKEAMRYLSGADGSIGVIVLDINMPDVDGIELLNAMQERANGTPVLFATGTTPDIRKAALVLARAYGLNVVGMMAKPFRANDFSMLIQKVIPARPIVA